MGYSVLAIQISDTGIELPPPVGGSSQLSPGSVAWLEVDLPPGRYAAVCYIIDPDASQPHALEGMAEAFQMS